MPVLTNQDALATVRRVMGAHIIALESALAGDAGGSIYCWSKYWLGAHIDEQGNASACAIDLASITSVQRHIVNGQGEPAVLMERRQAIVCALDDARMNLAKLEAMFAA
jgi:hypothetical protein